MYFIISFHSFKNFWWLPNVYRIITQKSSPAFETLKFCLSHLAFLFPPSSPQTSCFNCIVPTISQKYKLFKKSICSLCSVGWVFFFQLLPTDWNFVHCLEPFHWLHEAQWHSYFSTIISSPVECKFLLSRDYVFIFPHFFSFNSV